MGENIVNLWNNDFYSHVSNYILKLNNLDIHKELLLLYKNSTVPQELTNMIDRIVDLPELILVGTSNELTENKINNSSEPELSDALIEKLYRVAVYACGRVPDEVKIVLNDIITTIDVEKPVVVSYLQLDETEDIGKTEEGLDEIASSFKYF